MSYVARGGQAVVSNQAPATCPVVGSDAYRALAVADRQACALRAAKAMAAQRCAATVQAKAGSCADALCACQGKAAQLSDLDACQAAYNKCVAGASTSEPLTSRQVQQIAVLYGGAALATGLATLIFTRRPRNVLIGAAVGPVAVWAFYNALLEKMS